MRERERMTEKERDQGRRYHTRKFTKPLFMVGVLMAILRFRPSGGSIDVEKWKVVSGNSFGVHVLLLYFQHSNRSRV